MKEIKIKVRDPNAEMMWSTCRHKVELPKKGKGSYKRKTKYNDLTK